MKNYMQKHKIALMVLAIALCVILVSSFIASMIQSDAFRVTVTDLRDEAYSGKLTNNEGTEVDVKGTVASGILFVPKTASATNKLPAVVMTHGYLNNRELQLQNAIELARRGFIVLTIDRGGHGNNELSEDANAMMNTSGMYEAVQYLALQDYVDLDKIGITGHSMGGYTTAMTLATDAGKTGYGLISAGLMQGWSTFIAAGADVSVGMLKAMDDEFFFQSTLPDGTPSICREYLHSTGAAKFVGVTGYAETADSINIENGGIYINGQLTTVEAGKAAASPFRVIYEADEIHPLNHFSTESAGYITNFFYTAFGTPNGYEYIAEGRQTWWVKELFSTIGLIAFFALLLPIIDLLLTIPCFAKLRKPEPAEGEAETAEILPPLKGARRHVSYWVAGVLTTLFSGFSIQWIMGDGWLNKLPGMFFTQNTYFPQDTTGSVATWAVVCGLFALIVVAIIKLINTIIDKATHTENPIAGQPFAPAKINGGIGAVAKTIVVAFATVALMYLVVFINWAIWKVDFRIWTLDVKVFEVNVMLPTMLRYAVVFFIFYFINSILNQGYKAKNLPEWATIAINAVFNIFGILLVMLIQYGVFRSTGVLWQGDMALSYIVLFPIVPVLVIATIYSRRLYERTGNAWLGGVINALLFTIITVANTAASMPYAGFFA